MLQGWIFIIAGLTLMAPESERARRALDWAKKKVGAGGEATDPEDEAAEGEGKDES